MGKLIIIAILIAIASKCCADEDIRWLQEELRHQHNMDEYQHRQELVNEYNQEQTQLQWQRTLINQERMLYPDTVLMPPPAIEQPW